MAYLECYKGKVSNFIILQITKKKVNFNVFALSVYYYCFEVIKFSQILLLFSSQIKKNEQNLLQIKIQAYI